MVQRIKEEELRKRIALDLDNTICDFMSGAIEVMEETFGISVVDPEEQMIESAFNLTEERKSTFQNKWEMFGIDHNDPEFMANVRRVLYFEKRLFRKLPLLEEDIADFSKEIRGLGYKVYVVTARKREPEIQEDTLHWLEKNEIPFDDLFMTDSKGELCELMDIPLIFDDEPRHITSCLSRGVHVVARKQPWNEMFPTGPHMRGQFRHFNTWREALSIMEDLV